MYDIHNNVSYSLAISGTVNNTGSPEFFIGSGIDLQGAEAVEVILAVGDIDELGGSPVGSAKLELKLTHSDDNVTFTDVALADVIPHSSVSGTVTGGVVANTTGEHTVISAGYRGGKRYLRPVLVPTGLVNGGVVTCVVAKGNQRHIGTTV